MIEIIRDGSLERLLLVIFVFGGIILLLATTGQVDDRLIDIALVIVGFYFGTTVEKIRSSRNGSTKVLSPNKDDTIPF